MTFMVFRRVTKDYQIINVTRYESTLAFDLGNADRLSANIMSLFIEQLATIKPFVYVRIDRNVFKQYAMLT